MKNPTCDDVVDLIDLYAADECDPAQQNAVRAHVDSCGDCQRALEESRRLMGLLDVHFRQEEALSRLAARLEAEARPARRLERRLRIVHRFAAVAAMLLVTFGLGVVLFPAGTSPRPLSLQLSMTTLAAKPELAPPAMLESRDKSKAARVEKDKAVGVDQEIARGKTGKKFADDWPLPPPVEMGVRVTNPGRTSIELDVGGPEFRWELELRGGPVERHEVGEQPAYVPFRRRQVTIAAGGAETLRIERLASQQGARVEYLYPKAGVYEVRVRMEVTARRDGLRQTLRLRVGPRPLRLP
jgi:hypothetical protein